MFATFDAASEHCGGSGYGAGVVERVVFEKTRACRDRPYDPAAALGSTVQQMLVSLCMAWSAPEQAISVIDFGGACGWHYFVARSYLGAALRVRWHVVETDAMVARATALESQDLRFHTSIEDAQRAAGEIDLVYSSGALQYLRDPYDALRRLVACDARLCVATRLGLTRLDRELITIDESRLSDHGPGPMPDGIEDGVHRTPYTFARRDRVEQILGERYRILTYLSDTSGLIDVGGEPVEAFGCITLRA